MLQKHGRERLPAGYRPDRQSNRKGGGFTFTNNCNPVKCMVGRLGWAPTKREQRQKHLPIALPVGAAAGRRALPSLLLPHHLTLSNMGHHNDKKESTFAQHTHAILSSIGHFSYSRFVYTIQEYLFPILFTEVLSIFNLCKV